MSNLSKHHELMRLLVRLLGIFFVIDGIAGLIGHGVDCIIKWREASEFDMPFQGGYALAWTVASIFYLVAGLGLIFKSKIALDAIFHETVNAACDGGT